MSLIASPHTHPESPISGSTVETMVDRAMALGRRYFSYTDPAYMTSMYRGYDYAKSKGLKYIPGLEVFFKDPNCDIIKGSKAERASYFKLTLYATDQAGFEVLSQISSKDSAVKITHYGETYPVLIWRDLEEAASKGLIACSSDVHDIAAKHIVTNTPQLSEKIILKLKRLFGQKYFIAIIGNEITHSWVSLVHFRLQDGQEEVVPANSRITTNATRFARARELAENANKHNTLKSFQKNMATITLPGSGKKVTYAKVENGFIRLPEGDVQLKANKLMYALAKRHGIEILYSDYSFYAEPEDKAVQDVRLSQDDIKEHTKRHMQSSEEASNYLKSKMGLSDSEIDQIFSSNAKWASLFDNFSLKYDYRLPEVVGGKTSLELCIDQIQKLGRLPKDRPDYLERLRYEISVLAKNGKIDLTPYFLPIKDVLDFYRQNGRLTGPARGSAGGSLFLYLMGITQIDPIKYGLSFERFLSLDRVLNNDMPDVDVDLVDREPLVGEDGLSGYLYTRWGQKAAQISTRIQLRLKSAIKDVNRYFNGKIEPEIEKLSKALPVAPQGVSDQDFTFGFEDSDGNHIPGLIEINKDLQTYAETRPKEWALVQRCLGISRQVSKHASAFVIADTPIQTVMPTFLGNITQYEAKAVEKAKLIKYDFLVVNQLKDVELCINLINKKAGVSLGAGIFKHQDRELYIWDLPEEQEVFQSIWEGDTETIFQINTQSMVPFVKKIKPKSIEDLSTILALVRPGPLDFVDPDTGLTMADEYVERRNGRGTIKIAEMSRLLPETYGILVYQEQVSFISKELGGMSPIDAEKLRRFFSKKQKAKALEMKPVFMENAENRVGKDTAELIWQQMETFSRYGFNKSHASAYAMITYACMYLKHHYPLEWWAAVLSNADEGEISTVLFKHVREKVMPPDINLSTNNMEIDYAEGKIRAKLGVLKGLGETVAKPIIQNGPYSDIEDFIRKKVAGPSLTKKLIHVGVMDSLFPKNTSLIDKMQIYEDAINKVVYEEKIEKGVKATPPKRGKVDPEYLSLHPLEDFKTKKSILPTMPIALSPLVERFCPLMNEAPNSSDRPKYADNHGRPSTMLTGDGLAALEAKLPVERTVYFCVPAYVIKADEFSFQKNQKKALKLYVDIDGRISERVLWPPWGENAPVYPKNLKKGSVILMFMSAREHKNEAKITDIRVLA